MQNQLLFTEAAQQHGFSVEAAHQVLDMIESRLFDRHYPVGAAFYVFRIGKRTADEEQRSGGISRLLLAFPNADSAMAFAQRQGFRPLPRLRGLNVDQLLTVLLQRPAISALIFVDEAAEAPMEYPLPHGFRVNRATLLEMLQGGISYGQPF